MASSRARFSTSTVEACCDLGAPHRLRYQRGRRAHWRVWRPRAGQQGVPRLVDGTVGTLSRGQSRSGHDAGDRRYNDRWTDASLAHLKAERIATARFLKRFKAIDTKG